MASGGPVFQSSTKAIFIFTGLLMFLEELKGITLLKRSLKLSNSRTIIDFIYFCKQRAENLSIHACISVCRSIPAMDAAALYAFKCRLYESEFKLTVFSCLRCCTHWELNMDSCCSLNLIPVSLFRVCNGSLGFKNGKLLFLHIILASFSCKMCNLFMKW